MSHSNEQLTFEPLPLSENSSSQTVGWKRLKFGDVCKVQGGFAFKSTEYQKSGIPLVRISNLVNGKVSFDSDTVYLSASKLDVHKDFILKRGDTLIAMSGATTGKMATFDMDSPALLNQRVGRFRILSANACNPRFISLLVQQITRQVLKEAYGAAQPNISPSQIEQIRIPFPPIEEQNAIVAEIEKQFTRLEAGVAGLRRVQANLKRYRAAVLKAACEGKLVPTEDELAHREGRSFESGAQLLEHILAERRRKWNGKGKYKEPAKPDTTKLPPLPEGWTYAAVEQLGVLGEQPVLTGPFGTNLGREDFTHAGVPVLTISCLKDSGIFLDKALFVSELKANELERYRLKAGDFLFSRMASVGRAGIVGVALDGALFNYHIMRLRLEPSVLLPNYYMAYVRGSTQVDRYVRDVNHGATRDGINTEQLLSMPVGLPPVAEQQRIVAEVERRLSLVEELEGVVNANCQRATRFRQSILQRAFEGKIAIKRSSK